MKEKIIEFLSEIFVPFSRKNIVEIGFAESTMEKNDIFYILCNAKKINASESDIVVLKNKIESGVLIKFNKKCICIIEGENLSEKQQPGSNFSNSFKKIGNVKKTIAVISGKGGVGKTTVSIGLASYLSKLGFKVGICDLDIYGPSVPLFFGISQKHKFDNGMINPVLKNEIKISSMGMISESSDPIIWRGAMVSKAVNQLIRDVNWGELDYLIIDTPPGTGDVHLSLLQNFPINCTISVTTNDEISVKNTIKSVNMFRKLSKPVDFCIVNMSNIITEGIEKDIFGYANFAKENMQNIDILDFINIPVLNKKTDILEFDFSKITNQF